MLKFLCLEILDAVGTVFSCGIRSPTDMRKVQSVFMPT